jgi:uncharacterized protein DUF3563
MKATIVNLPPPVSTEPDGTAWAEDIRPHAATYFNAEMLHRTSGPVGGQHAGWPSDYFALERMARDLRRDNIAQLIYAAQISASDAASSLNARIGKGLKALATALARWLEHAIDDFDARASRRQQERREAFLSQATDVFDLERRMRELERSCQRPV